MIKKTEKWVYLTCGCGKKIYKNHSAFEKFLKKIKKTEDELDWKCDECTGKLSLNKKKDEEEQANKVDENILDEGKFYAK